jgi:SAM-dependent methyltransferase
MPGSFMVFDSAVERLIDWLRPASALDIGTGAGKYGEMLARLAPACQRVGIEPEASYAQRFELTACYDLLHPCTAAAWMTQALDSQFDLVILGDCIEHMSKSAGLDLLNFLVYRSAYVLVLAPEFIIQGQVGEVAGEAHVSVWSERDLGWHDLWAWDNCRAVSLLLLRGYQPAKLSLTELVERFNSEAVPIHEFHERQSPVRPARLRLVNLARETSYRVA